MVYTPKLPANITDVEELRRVMEAELQKLVESLPEQQFLLLKPLYRAPDKPREGMIAFADGVAWNPGSGIGTYEYRGGAWVKL